MEPKNHPLLFELLRSFTTLAETLNLSKAVQQLESTRQTVRRHISILEEIKGVKLFEVFDRQYVLTSEGAACLKEARDLQARGAAWLNNEVSHVDQMFRFSAEGENGWMFNLQQHPLSKIWSDPYDLFRRGVQSWANAQGDITHEAFDNIRQDMMIFRRSPEGWICAAVGSNSSYATWYGRKWEYSSVGRALPTMPGGAAYAKKLSEPFEKVRATRGLRLDHVQSVMSRNADDVFEPISFKRLLMGGHFPDGSFALCSLVVRSYDLEIAGVTRQSITQMAPKWVMDGSEYLGDVAAE